MEEGEDGTRGESSRMATPAPGGATPMHGGGETPMPDTGESEDTTPARPVNRFLDVDDATRASSGGGSPLRQATETTADVEMAEPDLDAPAKTSGGMEATAKQVTKPAEGVADRMDET